MPFVSGFWAVLWDSSVSWHGVVFHSFSSPYAITWTYQNIIDGCLSSCYRQWCYKIPVHVFWSVHISLAHNPWVNWSAYGWPNGFLQGRTNLQFRTRAPVAVHSFWHFMPSLLFFLFWWEMLAWFSFHSLSWEHNPHKRCHSLVM